MQIALTGSPSVFISYARSSSEPYARALHASLVDGGVSTFLDTVSIDHGDSIPDHVFDALLGARLLVALADPTYFTRRYCIEELNTALAASRALGRGCGEMARRAEALLPIVVAVGLDGQRGVELHQLPPELRDTKWPLTSDTRPLSAMVRERLGQIEVTFRERLRRAGALTPVEDHRREAMAVPPPRSLGGVPVYSETGLAPTIGDRFVGRARELSELHAALACRDSGTAVLTTVLEGGGGFGKTRLALEYVHRYGADYAGGVLWVDADVPPDRLESQLHGILRVLRPRTPDLRTLKNQHRDLRGELAAALRERSASDRVLYVVDNVPEPVGEQPPERLDWYCPAQPHVSLLVTSRVRLTLLAGLRCLQVRELSTESAVRMLTAGVEQRHTVPDEVWREISHWVGELPLALELLNSMLRGGACTPAQLLEAQRTRRPTQEIDRGMAVLRSMVPAGTLRGVTEALAISYRRLPEDARAAAHVLAWFSPDPIPMAVLHDEALFPPKARALLLSRSFVTEVRSDDVELYGQMHRSLADFLRGLNANPEVELEHAAESLSRAVLVEDGTDWPLLSACRSHVEAVFRHSLPITGPGSVIPCMKITLVLIHTSSLDAVLDGAERWTAAVPVAWPGHEQLTVTMGAPVARALHVGNRVPQGHELVEAVPEVLGGTLGELGEEHPVTLLSAAYLAGSLHEGPETLLMMVALARELASVDRWNHGPGPLKPPLTTEERHRTTTSPDPWLSMIILKLAESDERCDHLLAVRIPSLDEARPVGLLALSTRRVLKRISDEEVTPAELPALIQAAASGSTPELMVTRAFVCGGDGSRDELRDALDTSRRQHGAEHVLTLELAVRLGMVHYQRAEHGPAIDVLEPALRALRLVLGQRQLLTLGCMVHLGASLWAQGSREQARRLLDEACRIGDQPLGKGNQVTLMAVLMATLGLGALLQ